MFVNNESSDLNKIYGVRFANDQSSTLNQVCGVRFADDLPNPYLYAKR